MVFIYRYPRVLDIMEMLSSNQIVTLDVYLDDSLGEDAAEYVFKFTTINDYYHEEHGEILKCFENNDNISIISRAISGLSEFIEMKSLDNIGYFKYSFDIRTSKIYIEKSYLGKLPQEEEITFGMFMDEFEKYITNAGTHKLKLDMYHKVPNQNGKRPKYEQMTIGQVICMLKEINI